MSSPPAPAEAAGERRATNASRGVPGLHDRAVRLLSREVVAVPPCLVCSSTTARPAYEVEGVGASLVVCTICGLGYFHPMPSFEEIRAWYPADYYGQPRVKFHALIEWWVRFVGRRHVAFLTRGLAPGAAVLDVGCGRGVLLGPLTDRGFLTFGVEMSAEAVSGSTTRAEIRIASRLVDAQFPEASFDEVVIWHVLEHLADPQGTLLECRRILKPGGRLIVAVPNFSSWQARWAGAAWFHLDPPRHLYHFPVSALRRLVERCGFEWRATHHFSLRQNPFGWIQSALNLTGLPRNGLYTLLHRRERSSPLPFSARERLLMGAFFMAASPVAVALSVLEALAKSGATVHVVARRAVAVSVDRGD